MILRTFKKIEESNQKIKDRAMERNRQREIDDLNKKLRKEQGYCLGCSQLKILI